MTSMIPYTHRAYFPDETSAQRCAEGMVGYVARIRKPLDGESEWLLLADRDVHVARLVERHDEMEVFITGHGGSYDRGNQAKLPVLNPALSAGWPPCAPNRGGIPDQRYARRPLDGSAGYHLWSPSRGLSTTHCSPWMKHSKGDGFNERWRAHELGPPVPASQIPLDQRCGRWLAPRYMPRPYIGPLRECWPHEKMPLWYAWWRLHDLQDGSCACCDDAPAVIDHDHETGFVRGLLCVSCNKREADCRTRTREGTHQGRPCFRKYWVQPPAAELRWLYGKSSICAAA